MDKLMKNIIITGVNGEISKLFAERLKKEKDFDVSQISVRGSEWETLSWENTDCFIHAAGVTPQNIKTEDDYENVNYRLACRIAEKAKKEGVKKFIYISTMAVYGATQNMDAQKGTVTKKTSLNPKSAYGKSKLHAEEFLKTLQCDDFSVVIIRVPSIYGRGKTEYLDQYKYLAEKLPVIPYAFTKLYKSAICLDNLCELIYLAVNSDISGVICPDDGEISAVDFCSAIYPSKKKSVMLGKLIEIFLKKNARILDYYGAKYTR